MTEQAHQPSLAKALTALAALPIVCVALLVWANWGFVEWTTGGVFKPTWDDYQSMLAGDALIGLTPAQAAKLIEYPADVCQTEDGPQAEFYLDHVGFFTWITADLDEHGRITRVQIIVD